MIRELAARVRGLIHRNRADAEAEDEIGFHLEMETQANIARGMAPAEARRVALRDLGGVRQTREAIADLRTTLFDTLWQDVRFALRAFRRNPGFAFVAVLVLALGIAANTTLFSLVNAVLFRPLPVPDSGGLRFMSVLYPRSGDTPHAVRYSTFTQLAARRDVFSGVAGFLPDITKIGTGVATVQVAGERVTSEYFDVLNLKAALGRTFAASDDQPSGASPIVVSDRFWRTRLNADPHVVGATVDLRPPSFADHYSGYHRAYTVVGVMPAGFDGLWSVWTPAEYWVPLRQRTIDVHDGNAAEGLLSGSADLMLESRGIYLVARLQPGVTDAAFRGAALTAQRNMREIEWATSKGVQLEKGTIACASIDRGSLPFDPRADVVPSRLAMALMVVAGIVLLIAATNLAGILMARGVTRRGEVGVRLALGAGRARVARHVLTETTLLSLAGAVVALAFSRLFIGLFLAYLPGRIGLTPSALTAISLDVPIDVRVLLFTVALGALSGLLVGFTPALQALHTDVMATLASGSGPAPATRRSAIRRWVVIPQICLSLVLLLGAGVLVRALLRAELSDRGFDSRGVVYADLRLPMPGDIWTTTKEQWSADVTRRRATYQQLLPKIRSLPGVDAVAFATKSSWNGDRWGGFSVVTRSGYAAGQNRWVSAGEVSAGYFEAMRIPILRGRSFDGRDTATTTPVAIVCERLARTLWPGQDAIGQYIANYEPKGGKTPTWLLVVGVVKEVKVAGREDRPTPFFYMPIEQRPWPVPSIVVRGQGNPRELLKTVLAGVAAVRSDAEITRARTLDEEIGEVLYPRRLGAAILAVSGLFGLLLSTVGLYGVVSYSTAQRLREIGIRTALGAARRDIVVMLLGDTIRPFAIAVACGVGLGYAGVRLVSSMVVAIPALDTLTVAAVVALLSAVILTACMLPARRASRVNPIEVLRVE